MCSCGGGLVMKKAALYALDRLLVAAVAAVIVLVA
jgi:hypothetical protein